MNPTDQRLPKSRRDSCEDAFKCARRMTPTERQRFVLWCKERGILQIVAEMAARIWIATERRPPKTK
jgi:hypothetical protein